jgi:uncharacterized protein
VIASSARGAVVIAIAWICLTCAGIAQTLTFPWLSGRVVDEAGLLDPTDRAALTGSLASLEAKTTNQLVVVTLKSLQGTSIEDYGYQLGRHWQIGQKDKNTGVLLIVAASERRVRIEVGYGLEGTLTDALTKYIIETSILPRFKAGDLPGGIKLGVEQIARVLGGDADDLKRSAAQSTSPDPTRSNSDAPLWTVIVVVLVGVGFLIFCAVTRGGSICQGILQILFVVMLSGRGRSSREGSSFSGGGGSFGGGGSSGSW